MLAHDRRLPEPVLVVLPKKPREAAARRVEDPDRRVEHDLPAGEAQPEVELVVLVTDERLVEEACPFERIRRKCPIGHGVDLDALVLPMARPVNPAERAVHGAGHRALGAGAASRNEDAADVLGPGLLGRGHAPPHVVRRVPAMAVDADDQAPGGRADARVETGGDPARRVVENGDLDPLPVGRGPQQLRRTVGRGSVGDQQLELSVEVLRGDVGHEAVDVRRLVPHRRNHRDALHAGDFGFTHT